MTAPIITFVFAGVLGYLCWKFSAVTLYLDETNPVAEQMTADGTPVQAGPDAGPAEDAMTEDEGPAVED
jgi:hypothetical protein